jgi:hypothetical protein
MNTLIDRLRDMASLLLVLWSDETGMDAEEQQHRPVHLAMANAMREAADRLESLEARIEARRFGKMVAEKYNALLTESQKVTCAFCGQEYPRGTPRHGDGLLAEHIKVCPQHPMRQVEADLAAAQARVAELEGEVDVWRVGAIPTDQPHDEAGRLILNAYGRNCYDTGRKQAESALAAIMSDAAFRSLVRQCKERDAHLAQLNAGWARLADQLAAMTQERNALRKDLDEQNSSTHALNLAEKLRQATALGARLAQRLHEATYREGYEGFDDDMAAARALGWVKG